jgi:molybdenum cofactor synthesis domain-containing protein
MRPFTATIPIADARAIVDATIRPLERTERVTLDAARGRVLAETIAAAADVPPFARATMDGYALRADDTAGATTTQPRRVDCLGQAFTGDAPAHVVGPGQAVEIATGAPLPPGADAVVMVESTHRDGRDVRVFAPVVAGQNVGPQGADIRAGQIVLEPGRLLTPSQIGALAALGLADVAVYASPRVAILSTGNEIVAPGQPLGPGQIHDINRYTLAAIVTDNGGTPVPRRTAQDTLDDLERAVSESQDDDLILFSGGSSVGERDLLADVLAHRGRTLFHGLAVKPGKPTAFGVIGATPFFGLPGHPASCLSNAYILVVPALRTLAHLPPRRDRTLTLPLARDVTSVRDRHQFFSVRIVDGTAVPAFKGSSDITSLSQADGYIEIPVDVVRLPADTLVEVTLFA